MGVPDERRLLRLSPGKLLAGGLTGGLAAGIILVGGFFGIEVTGALQVIIGLLQDLATARDIEKLEIRVDDLEGKVQDLMRTVRALLERIDALEDSA